MEVGLGIAFQDSAPLYLMDGEHQIMISDAINESDRLSSCSKRVRKKLAQEAGVFQVYRFEVASNHDDPGVEAGLEDLRLSYNVGGICLSEPAFRKLQEEIALTPCVPDLRKTNSKNRWLDAEVRILFGHCAHDEWRFPQDRNQEEPPRAG